MTNKLKELKAARDAALDDAVAVVNAAYVDTAIDAAFDAAVVYAYEAALADAIAARDAYGDARDAYDAELKKQEKPVSKLKELKAARDTACDAYAILDAALADAWDVYDAADAYWDAVWYAALEAGLEAADTAREAYEAELAVLALGAVKTHQALGELAEMDSTEIMGDDE
tara:strand:+ start:9541 stop:10053 length:513 start_codon:yes stop_codon:yes gene_type:complete